MIELLRSGCPKPFRHSMLHRALRKAIFLEEARKRAAVDVGDQLAEGQKPAKSARVDYSSGEVSGKLFDKVCSGQLGVKDSVRFAQACVTDYGDSQEQVNKWASLGSLDGGNTHRAFKRWATKYGLMLSTAHVNTPVRNLRDHGVVSQQLAILYPHEVFAAIFGAGAGPFQRSFVGPGGLRSIRDFWERQARSEWVVNHPGFGEYGAQPSMSLPFGFHADKGQHTKRDKILVMSWGSCLSTAPTEWSKLLFGIIPDERMIHGLTDERLYSVFVWSCIWMAKGAWPPTDHDGNPWPPTSRRCANAGKPLAGSGSQTFVPGSRLGSGRPGVPGAQAQGVPGSRLGRCVPLPTFSQVASACFSASTAATGSGRPTLFVGGLRGVSNDGGEGGGMKEEEGGEIGRERGWAERRGGGDWGRRLGEEIGRGRGS